MSGEFVAVCEADEAAVREIVDALAVALEAVLKRRVESGMTRPLDMLMAASNFHTAVVRAIEDEYGIAPFPCGVSVRRMAVDTFARALPEERGN